MYKGYFDKDAEIFHATLTDQVEIAELAQGLKECFATTYAQGLKVVWDISKMRVAFGLGDVDQLLEIFQAGGVPKGKFAFVIGQQEFLRGVVQSVRTMRTTWSTDWQVFTETPTAVEWLKV